jgi:hypothetical protein
MSPEEVQLCYQIVLGAQGSALPLTGAPHWR